MRIPIKVQEAHLDGLEEGPNDMTKRRPLARTSLYVGEDQIAEMRRVRELTGVPMGFLIRRGIDLALADYSHACSNGKDPTRPDAGQQAGDTEVGRGPRNRDV
jgi:hypothetical protein